MKSATCNEGAISLNQFSRAINTFPNVSYEEFEQITDISLRREIVKRNRILMTDTYNRTMEHTKGFEKSKEVESYTLTFRKSPNSKYNIVYGVRQTIKHLFEQPITQLELDFAKAFYAAQAKKGGVSYFNADLRQEIIDVRLGYIPLTIKAVADGTAMKAKEPILTVKGHGELAARFEPLLLRIFYPSAVATGAHMIEEILSEGRVVEFGMRSALNDDSHFDAIESLIVGMGIKGTSNDMAAAVYPQTISAGTTAHRYYSAYPTEDEAFERNILENDKVALLVDLVDSHSGIRKAIALKKKYRSTNKPIAIRLDSGDLTTQAIYALTLMEKEGMMDPLVDKIIISDVSSFEQLIEIETRIADAGFDPKKFIMYGLGGLLIAKGKTRDELSAGYKLTNTTRGATGKMSNDIGKESIPGEINVIIKGKKRIIVQEEEKKNEEGLLETVYDYGIKNYFSTYSKYNDIQAVDVARARKQESIKRIDYPTELSRKTTKLLDEVRERLRANMN